MKRFAFFLFVALSFLPVSAFAQDSEGFNPPPPPPLTPPRDKYEDAPPFDWNSLPEEYRTTKEQMEAEAQEVFFGCDNDGHLKKLYSCECLSGAYLQLRERLGPAPTRRELTYKIQTSANPNCADVPLIATDALANCMAARARTSPTDPDNEAFCNCVAYTLGSQFETRPQPEPAYIMAAQAQANRTCRDPSKRPILKSTAPQDSLGVNTPPPQ